jgi:hypothetical protein
VAIDQKRVGEHVAAQMEAIEQQYGGEESEAEIGNILTIVEVLSPNGPEVRIRPSDPRPWVIIGLLRWAEENTMAGLGLRRGGEE